MITATLSRNGRIGQREFADVDALWVWLDDALSAGGIVIVRLANDTEFFEFSRRRTEGEQAAARAAQVLTGSRSVFWSHRDPATLHLNLPGPMMIYPDGDGWRVMLVVQTLASKPVVATEANGRPG